MLQAALCLALAASGVTAQHYSATYLPSNAPKHSEDGQTGTNQCGTASNQTSMCQNAYINSVSDFCLWAPPEAGPGSVIGNTERIEVAWCMKSGTGARLIPDGTIKGAHFVQTPDYVQITGVGDLTKINIPKGDQGGELDPHGADGNGNPIGGLVFSTAFGKLEQLHEWTNFMSFEMFCFRGCKDGPNAPKLCQHIYDVMGCEWNMPANYDPNVFEQCQGDTGEPMGIYGSSTFHQDVGPTPPAHPRPKSSSCTTFSTIANDAVTTTPASPTGTNSVGGPSPSDGGSAGSTPSAITHSSMAGSATQPSSAGATDSSRFSSPTPQATGTGASGTKTGTGATASPTSNGIPRLEARLGYTIVASLLLGMVYSL